MKPPCHVSANSSSSKNVSTLVGEAPSVKLGPEEADCLRLIALFGGRLRRNPIRIAKDNN